VRCFEDTREGEVIGPVVYGPITIMHLVRWCAATENWHRIHYDHDFCRNHEGLPGPLINGTWKQQVLAQVLKEWVGPTGWLGGLKVQFRGMDVVGETLRVQGRVLKLSRRGDYGEAECTIEMVNSSGQATTTAEARLLLPLRDGAPVPYPPPWPVADEHAADSRRERSSGSCPPEFEKYVGVTSDVLVSPDPVDSSSVRRFMQAIMANDADYYDPTSAGARRYGGVVAPPLYPLHAFHVRAGDPDPLDESKERPDFDGAAQTAWSSFGLPRLEGAPQRILNAGNDIEVYSYAPLGARIAVSSTYDDIYLKTGRQGPLLFVATLSRYTVYESGQPLAQSRQLIILR
jgi:acyl dehydratase